MTVAAWAIVLALASLVANASASPTLYRQSRRVMGTAFEIQVYDVDAARAESAITSALDDIERTDHLLSNYDPSSELSAMNRDAARAPFHVSDPLFEFIAASRRYYAATDRAFDPTVGPLVRAWGFFTPHPGRPSDQAIAAAKARSGFDKVRLDPDRHTVSFTAPGLEFDPGGIGKGHAVDRAADVLKKAGMTSALVSAGGSTLFAIGHPPNRTGWRIAIKDPLDPNLPYGFVVLRDASLSTSGVSEKFVVAAGHRYAHIFDPRTGEPVEGMCQATVVAPTATESDALSKPAFILARDSVVEVFKRFKDTHVLRVEGECGKGGAIWTTPWSGSVFEP